MYIVVITKYGKGETKSQPMTFKDAYTYASGASAVAEAVWTRHSAIKSSVRHMDTYYDMFNEGSINLEKVS